MTAPLGLASMKEKSAEVLALLDLVASSQTDPAKGPSMVMFALELIA